MSQHLSQRLVSLHSSSELIKRMRRIKLNLGFSGSQFSFAQRWLQLTENARAPRGAVAPGYYQSQKKYMPMSYNL